MCPNLALNPTHIYKHIPPLILLPFATPHRCLSRFCLIAMGVQETSSGNRTGDTDLTQADFDTNMVIILAALLCALICALGLNSMVRCFLRCTRRLGIETAEQAAARVAATGLKKSALRKIPVVVYGSENEGSGSGSECPICLGEFVDGDKVRVLPNCNHGFHVRCIDTWLGGHSSCPICRHSLLEPFGSAVRGGGGAAAPPHLGGESGGAGGRQEHVVVEVNAEA